MNSTRLRMQVEQAVSEVPDVFFHSHLSLLRTAPTAFKGNSSPMHLVEENKAPSPGSLLNGSLTIVELEPDFDRSLTPNFC